MATRRPVVTLVTALAAVAMAALAPVVVTMRFEYEETTTEAALRSLYVRWLAQYGDHELLAGRRKIIGTKFINFLSASMLRFGLNKQDCRRQHQLCVSICLIFHNTTPLL